MAAARPIPAVPPKIRNPEPRTPRSIGYSGPATGVADTVYPQPGQRRFFTRIMGAQQLLPNGNRLITESMAGRLLEVDASGNTVWEYVKPFDSTHAAILQSAKRYPPGFFTVRDWSCPGAR